MDALSELGTTARLLLLAVAVPVFVFSSGALVLLLLHVLNGMPLSTASLPFGLYAPVAGASGIVLYGLYETHDKSDA